MEGTWPFTATQRAIWIDQLINPNSSKYNIGGYARINGMIHQNIFQSSLKILVNETDLFKLFLIESEEAPSFYVHDSNELKLDCIDFSQNNAPFDEALAWMNQDMCEPFVLGNNLYKFVLLKINDNNYFWYTKAHHLLIDGWGLSLIFKNVAYFYSCLKCGIPYSPSNYCFTHYLEESVKYLNSEKYIIDKSFWLSKYPTVPERLFTEKLEPFEEKCGNFSFPISRANYSVLTDFCTTQGISLFHVFLSLLFVYLSRAYGRNEVVIAAPILNRSDKKSKNTIGIFMNVIPILLTLKEDITLTKLFQFVKKEVRECLRYQNFPIDDLKIDNQSHGKFYNVRFSYEKHNYGIEFDDFNAEIVALQNPAADVELSVFLREYSKEKDVMVDINYSTSTFPFESILNFSSFLEKNLLTLSTQATKLISEIDLLTETEFKRLKKFNGTNVNFPLEETVISLFEKQVLKSGNEVAAIFKNKALTYNELHERSNQLCRYLKKQGVREGMIVPVCVDRSLEMLIAVLAVMKLGSAYVPLEASHGFEHIKFVLQDTAAEFLLTSSQLPFDNISVKQINIVEDAEKIASEPILGIKKSLPPESLAYIIYTSGSTGRQKGVMIEHKSLSNFLFSMIEIFHPDKTSSLLAITTYTFDISCLELFLPLIVGAKLIIASRESAMDARLLTEEISKYKPTYMQATPSTWEMLFDYGWKNPENIKILVGGEPLINRLKNTILLSTRDAWNLYGPTETTIWCTISKLKNDEDVNIGSPLPNTHVYILDKFGKLLPIGKIGEMYIGGVQVARGYLNRNELTSSRFMQGSFSTNENTMIYKTGDLARWDQNGKLEYLGRTDDQVKIRGYRIELGEIDAVLNSHPNIKRGVVTANRQDNYENKLVAFVTCIEKFDQESINKFLSNRLPFYMVPSLIIELKTLPLTNNGKIDKKALPIPTFAELFGDKYKAPTNDIEWRLTVIWQKLLLVDQIGINDNFFELGGHSLKANILSNKIYTELLIKIPISEIFKNPTIKELAKLIIDYNNEQFNFIELC